MGWIYLVPVNKKNHATEVRNFDPDLQMTSNLYLSIWQIGKISFFLGWIYLVPVYYKIMRKRSKTLTPTFKWPQIYISNMTNRKNIILCLFYISGFCKWYNHMSEVKKVYPDLQMTSNLYLQCDIYIKYNSLFLYIFGFHK